MNKIIRVENLCKSFGDNQVLNDVSLDVHQGEVMSIIGPSGGGKTTLLRCLNLLNEPDSGNVYFEGENLIDPKTDLNKLRMKMGMVFQNFNLFNQKTVLQNLILAPIKLLKMSRQEATNKAIKLLQEVNMQDFINTRVEVLSGGQKQRVAIARALMMDPEIMLFDEPTSALDPEMTHEVLQVMTNLAKKGMTMVIVSHELSFVLKISNRIVFIADGKIEEINSPKEIVKHPKSEKTKLFLKQFLE
ncbi:MAG: amino acid ABC transporter ATP-binding protein [Acholeplasmataceae bacterium]